MEGENEAIEGSGDEEEKGEGKSTKRSEKKAI